MSKLNKRGGFTLAELLIVVAIIAILIAIAIPVFGGQLDNAKIQTDHANMRSAYALAQTGTIQGGVYKGQGGQEWEDLATGKNYYFLADGSIDENADNAYKLKATASGDKCKESAVCTMNASGHQKGYVIHITVDGDAYKVKLEAAPSGGPGA